MVGKPVCAFKLTGVTFSYASDGYPALEDVSLSIAAGSCVVITGASGCGKTTLTRLMNGLIPVVYEGEATGSVSVMGKPIEEWSMGGLSSRVGSVFQNPRSQFVNTDTTSEIAFGCENQGIARAEMLERVHQTSVDIGVRHLLGRAVEDLSGGEKQLVILASVHAMHPDVLVLDEPTASLDVRAMQRLGEVVAGLKAQGKTVIVSEHRLWWLADVVDRVIFLEDGRIAGDWTAQEFAAMPLSERAQRGLRAWTIDEIDLQFEDVELGDGQVGASDDRVEASASATVLPVVSEGLPEHRGVRVSGLQAGYRRDPQVLRDVDFELRPGRVVGILGRNGAGKTTLARCIAGLLREKAGAVEIDGAARSFRHRAGCAYLVMQESGYQLFSNTVEGELDDALPADVGDDGDRRAQVQAMLRSFGLDGLSARHPLSLSGGQRQRLSIAAGLLHGAQALVLDEPTSGLDFGNMQRVAQELSRIKAQGLSVCLVSHDYEFLCKACDDIAVLQEGRIACSFPLTRQTLPRVKEQMGL